MKKTILIAAAFVFAVASAFTTKAFNVTGWANDGLDNPVSGTADQPNCSINNTGANCTMTVSNVLYGTIYDSQTDIGVSTKVFKQQH